MPQEVSGFLVCDPYHHLYPRSLVQRTFNHPSTQRMPFYVLRSTICPFIHPTFTYQLPPTNHTLSTPHLWSNCSSQRWGCFGAPGSPYAPSYQESQEPSTGALLLFFLLEQRRHLVEMQVGRGGLSVSFQLLTFLFPYLTPLPSQRVPKSLKCLVETGIYLTFREPSRAGTPRRWVGSRVRSPQKRD